ncbi:MAG: endonuclease VII domain-containing protein [Chloroflexota bacterium]|nr:endonuclease VII domain-containing protein [Chloroflexota bacterium]
MWHIDSVKAGRPIGSVKSAWPKRLKYRKTSCPHGHEYTDENIYYSPDGGRHCRICQRARQAKKYRQELYGLDFDDHLRIVEAQRGICLVCGQPPPGGANLSVDHEHASGIVRGLPCSPCNQGLGIFRDDPARLRAAAVYLERAVVDVRKGMGSRAP